MGQGTGSLILFSYICSPFNVQCSEFSFSLLRERTGNITQGRYILFPIDPNVLMCSLLFPLFPVYPTFPPSAFSIIPSVYMCRVCSRLCPVFPVWSPLFPLFFPPLFPVSVSRLFLVFWLCNLWEATLTSPLVGGMWTDTIGNTLGNILRTIGKNGEHTGYTLGTRPTVWIIERAHWERQKHRGGRVEGLSSCFLRIRSSFNVQCLWAFL